MRRISTTTRQIDKFGPGKPGFTNGNALTGVAATDQEDVWLDHVQEELCNIAEAKPGVNADGSSRTQVLDAIRFLIQSATGSAGGLSNRNRIANGAAQIASRAAANLSTTAQIGQVDLVAGKVSGGAVSAGTIAQDTAAPVGRTGFAMKFAGCTLTGAGQISWLYRMEAADAIRLKNQTAIFQVKVEHDLAAPANYTTIFRKANSADNFNTSTVIATSAPVAIGPSAPSLLIPWVAGVPLGDCSNGLEIEIQVACGAVAAKNFWFTEWQLEEGTVTTPFEFKSKGEDLMRTQRYTLVVPTSTIVFNGWSGSTGSPIGTSGVDFPVEMRVPPSVPSIAFTLNQCNTPSVLSNSTRSLRFGAVGTTAAGSAGASNTSPFIISADLF
jgi:hypothetical protein